MYYIILNECIPDVFILSLAIKGNSHDIILAETVCLSNIRNRQKKMKKFYAKCISTIGAHRIHSAVGGE